MKEVCVQLELYFGMNIWKIEVLSACFVLFDQWKNGFIHAGSG